MQNLNQDAMNKLEFNTLKAMLASHAQSDAAKAKCLALAPFMDETRCKNEMRLTTGARNILDAAGSPPLAAMQGLDEILTLCRAGAMLVPDQLLQVEKFVVACARMQQYLHKATGNDEGIAAYGASFHLLPGVQGEINRCIRAGQVDAAASGALGDIRRKLEHFAAQAQSTLAQLAQRHRQYLSDSGVVQRSGRYVLAVRREHKNKISGTIVDTSGTGSTLFIEPAAVAKLHSQMAAVRLEEENEVRRVLYTLSVLVDDAAPQLRLNIEAMETLDFLFAKAKFSAALKAGPVRLNTAREVRLVNARHPLLNAESCVPLNLSLGEKTRGIVITGPNTGGKTVALKTVGLLCLMAQCGLHVTAAPESAVCLQAAYLCDLGDGQSIRENLSTFSSHMRAIIGILKEADGESLVLLDELGSGTDPAEGMGIAVAVLEALRQSGCMLVATTHYPEVKQYAEEAPGFTNARMAFNRDSLQPTYRLEVGKAGESCALYIARRLGLPGDILRHAEQAAHRDKAPQSARQAVPLAPPPRPQKQIQNNDAKSKKHSRIQKAAVPKTVSAHAAAFGFGDSVMVSPGRQVGIVFHTANDKGEIGVQMKGEKQWLPHKRLSLLTKAEMLYPEDYDFSVVFDSVENRNAKKQIDKGHHIRGNVIHHDGFAWEKE